MSLTSIALVALAAVDIAALCIGLSIRRKVVGIITSTGSSIEAAVKAGIADAVRGLLAMVAQLLPQGGAPIDPAARSELLAKANEVLERLG